MAAVGQDFNETLLVAQKVEVASQNILAVLGGSSNVTVNTAGPGSIVVTRKYIPTWAIVVAVIGTVLWLLGLLALFARNTEVLTVTLRSEQGGTRVNITGRSSHEILTKITGVLNSLAPLQTTASGELNSRSTDTSNNADSKICPDCGESVRTSAKLCRFCRFEFEVADGLK
jgi:hypothetical protein